MGRQLIIGVDFDGTVVTHHFPKVGFEVPGAIATIRALQENKHLVFLWTMRGYQDTYPRVLEDAKSFFRQKGIELDGINESPVQFSTSPKQFANFYIDDSNLGTPLTRHKGYQVVNWELIAKELWEVGAINRDQFEKIVNEVFKNLENE